MQRFRRLMVGLSRSPADAGLVEYAAGVARLGTVEEGRFVHVLRGSNDDTPESDVAAARSEMTAVVEHHFRDAPERVRREFDVLTGPMMDRLLAYSADNSIDLLMIGHGGDQPGRRALARRLAMKSPSSIWVVPNGSLARISRLVVATDFSLHAVDTMRVAVEMARTIGNVEVDAVHVYFDESVAQYEGFDRVLRDDAAKAYEKFIAQVDTHDVTVTPIFEEGPNVAVGILRVAERIRADLVVLGTRGRSRSAAILLGSVAEEAIISTQIPLLAVKHFGAQLGLLQVLLQREFLRGSTPHTD